MERYQQKYSGKSQESLTHTPSPFDMDIKYILKNFDKISDPVLNQNLTLAYPFANI